MTTKKGYKNMNEDALFEDNNGGDVLEIFAIGEGKYKFQSGHACVFDLKKTGTISEITRWLRDISLALPEDFETLERR